MNSLIWVKVISPTFVFLRSLGIEVWWLLGMGTKIVERGFGKTLQFAKKGLKQ